MELVKKIIVSVDDLSDSDVSRLFFSAHEFKNSRQNFRNYKTAVLMTAFFEPSTRTRLSFEMAAHRLGMASSAFHAVFSSIEKGESEIDTINNLLALNPTFLVIRKSTTIDKDLFRPTSTAIINGGDGINEHPSQALLDCFTLLEHFGTEDLHGKKIVVIGDIAHSRVARSNIKLMSRLGAEVFTLAPSFLKAPNMGQKKELSSFKDIDFNVDAVMCLRIQKERMERGVSVSFEKFDQTYLLTQKRLDRLGSDCVILHQGPLNLGVEIDDDVAKDKRSLILKQVENGVFVRASLMDLILKEQYL